MLGMPARVKHTENFANPDPNFQENITKEDFLSKNAGMTFSWNVNPRYNTKGEQSIHQRLKKKLEEKKNKQK